MSAALAHYALAELRGSARVLGFFVGCLAVGVGAVVAVKGTSSGIEAGVRAHARELLGADAVVQSWRALPEVSSALAETGARMTLVKEMVTLVARVDGRQPGRSQLVELRAVGAGYPFYGPPRLEPDRRLGELLDRETTVVADELLDRMGLGVGDTLRIGGQDFRIAGRVLSEADTLSGSLRLGPRVFVSTDGLARTSLEAFGSRILRRALVKLPPGGRLADAERLVARLRERWKERDDLRIETYRDMQPAVRRTIDRMEPYLALVALVSLLLGGIGVGQGIRVWIRQRLGSVAILKALGVRPRQVLTLYLIQTLLLAAVGSGLGILLGLAVPRLLPALLGEALPPGILRPAVMGPILHGLAIGAGVAVLFSLGPLLAVWRVPPLRVLRRDAEPLPLPRIPRILGLILLFLGVAGVASVLSGSVRRGTEGSSRTSSRLRVSSRETAISTETPRLAMCRGSRERRGRLRRSPARRRWCVSTTPMASRRLVSPPRRIG